MLRHALVTGASSGLGRELVRQLVLDRGMTVLATARRLDRLESLAAASPRAGSWPSRRPGRPGVPRAALGAGRRPGGSTCWSTTRAWATTTTSPSRPPRRSAASSRST
ncbi:MAG: SDR family NAD(P)-dependent oxidoreductase [Singulisphaera sp.]